MQNTGQNTGQQTGGLSVEEILESIKKVIARDNGEVASAERRRRETTGILLREPAAAEALEPAGEDDEDSEAGEVLDLGDADAEMLGEARSAAEPEDVMQVEVEDTGPEAGEYDLRLIADEPFPEAELPSAPAEPAREPLAMLAAIQAQPDASDQTEIEAPLERMVRETLRPMLGEWLDANLPQIVERLVKVEIERISGKPR